MPTTMFIFLTIFLTVLLYLISRKIFLRTKNPIFNPVLLSTTIIIIIFHYTGITFEQYKPGKDIMTFLLGPATVALALPLYLNRTVLLQALFPIIFGICFGALATLTTAILLAKLSGLDALIVTSIAPKSITAPIAIEISRLTGGDPAIAVAFVVFTGTFGSIIGPSLLSFCKITTPIARGLAMGVTSHGQGTATILQEGALQGAMAGIAMAVAAIFISFIAPLYIPWLVNL
ncbi:LrgB family protein [Pelosinus propionicus]|uniref:TIGR00659 family protein n=1 Tax=Pelosinus propionicus DSM 13327 TaxID=1123291 RepID=A0A1I4NCZ9_9FIRM|nr:LrgB family protein [Pelosinus propionicus]SFM13256.1 TIGR00659 family protein [Pelosinus propionicus DSM 13327]